MDTGIDRLTGTRLVKTIKIAIAFLRARPIETSCPYFSCFSNSELDLAELDPSELDLSELDLSELELDLSELDLSELGLSELGLSTSIAFTFSDGCAWTGGW